MKDGWMESFDPPVVYLASEQLSLFEHQGPWRDMRYTSWASAAAALWAAYYALERLCRRNLIWQGKFNLCKIVVATLLKNGLASVWGYIDRLLIWSSLVYKRKDLLCRPPTSLDDVRKEWLTCVLQENGVLGAHTAVDSVSVTAIDAGQTGHCGVLRLEYSNASLPASPLPESMIIKMSRKDFAGTLLNVVVRLYRECHVYSDLLPSLKAVVPTCRAYYSDVNAWTKHFILLLEDASTHPSETVVAASTIGTQSCDPEIMNKQYRALFWTKPPPHDKHMFPPDVISPATIQRTRKNMEAAVRAIAAMHAKFWCDETLLDLDLDSFAVGLALAESDWAKTRKVVRRQTGQRYEGTTPWRGCADVDGFERMLYDTVMCPFQYGAMKAGVENWRENWPQHVTVEDWFHLHRQLCFSRIHGDFHTENIFVRQYKRASNDADIHTDIVVLDWQICDVGFPVKDIAQILSLGGLDLYGTALHEEAIVKVWWEELVRLGVNAEEFPFRLAWAQYKYFASHVVALLLLMSNTLNFFSEDHVYYMHFVDKFNDCVRRHGHPVENYGKLMAIVETMAEAKKAREKGPVTV